MYVYAEIAGIYPTRIFKIYIRKTRRQLPGNRQEQLNKLEQSGVPFMYFSDEDPVEKEIKSIDKLINKP
jgi:phosphatidate phosphatase APP1